MPTYQLLTDRTLAQSSAITPTTLIHIVTTGDTSQNPAGSSYKAELGQLASLFSGGTFTGNTSATCINELYVSDIYGCTGVTFHNNVCFETIPTQTTGYTLSVDVGGCLVLATGKTITQEIEVNRVDVSERLKVSKIRSFSPLFINDGDEGNVYFGSTSGVTIDVLNSRIGIGNNTPSEKLEVSGNTRIYGTLSADTISATTYQNLPDNVTGNYLPLSGGTVSGETSFTNGLTANTISATTIGNSGDCVDDLYVTNIHSCSPLNINPLNEGNVYFGSTSGVTIDLTNTRIGIGTSTPQFPFQVVGTNSRFYYDPTSVGGRFNISGNTNIPRYDVSIGSYLTRPATGGSVGMRSWNDVTFPGYGKVGDMHIYAGNEVNGLNIISTPGTNTEDYIRFYAGTDATSTSDIHIQGTGTTRGFVGLGTESPIEKLHVVGNAFVSGNVSASTLSANTLILSGVTVNPKQLIALFFGHDSLSPGDTQTYYIGNSINLTAPISGSDGRRVTIPKTGNIIRVGIVQTVGGTLGSSETSTITVNNVTQATQSTITTTFTYDSSSANISYDLSSPLAVNQGDKIELRWTTPAWVTNPTAVRQQMNVYLEY